MHRVVQPAADAAIDHERQRLGLQMLDRLDRLLQVRRALRLYVLDRHVVLAKVRLRVVRDRVQVATDERGPRTRRLCPQLIRAAIRSDADRRLIPQALKQRGLRDRVFSRTIA